MDMTRREKTSENFRKALTSAGKIMLAGKNAEQNEQVVNQVGKDEYILHTASPGSPFVNIKANLSNVTKKELVEAAIFCARHSQAWKKAKTKRDIDVHVFIGKDIFKTPDMKLGTFGVKKFKNLLVKKEDILSFEM